MLAREAVVGDLILYVEMGVVMVPAQKAAMVSTVEVGVTAEEEAVAVGVATMVWATAKWSEDEGSALGNRDCLYQAGTH